MANENPNFQEVEERNFKIEDFLIVILSKWYWIVLSVILAVTAATLWTLRSTPIYTRSAALLIKNDENNTSSINQEFKDLGIFSQNANINNEIIILSAPVLMEETVKRAHTDIQMTVEEGLHNAPLYDNSPITLLMPEASDQFGCSFKMKLLPNKKAELWDFVTDNGINETKVTVDMGTLGRTPVGKVVIQPTKFWGKTFTDQEITVTKYPVKAIAGSFSGRLSVTLADKEASILNINLSDASLQRAEDMIYKLIDVYNEQWLKDRNRVAESTYQFITERLNTLSKELGDVDQKISDYKSSTLLPDLDQASAMYLSQSQRNTEEILTLNNQLSVAKYIKDYLNDRTKEGKYLPTNTGIGSTGIEQMIANYNRQVSLCKELRTNSSDNSPIVQRMLNDLAQQRNTIIHSLENLISQLNSQIKNWQRTEGETNQKLASAPRQVKQLLSIGRQQKVKESLYIYLLQKREENELSKTYTAWNTRIIQPPTGSNMPTSPRKRMILLVAFGIGLAIPIGILFLRDTMDHTVRGRADLDEMPMPLLGEIPAMVQKKHWWQRGRKNVDRMVYIEENSLDLINESFRILRTKLDYFVNSFQDGSKVIMLTSFNAGSGKSFITANLSKVIGLKNKKVLAIDLDLRHCSLSGIVGQPKVGISHYLAGLDDNTDALIKKDALCIGVDVMPVGIIPPNPTELLLNNKMGELMEKVKDQYDYIIIDCPPIDIVADTIILKK
ncbi:MAG: AAA family ATPase, partial [Prevotellamassilia sp.]|nr:AAA family ATPase [Prevotellamassilia sp.]